MAHEIPASGNYTGLKRTVLQYVEAFADIIRALKAGETAAPEWAVIERLVDVENFERLGVFGTATAQRFGWATYRDFVTRFAAQTEWEATLRHISEDAGRVILELTERTPRAEITHEAHTVTTYEFATEGRLSRLEVYVMPLS